MRDAGNNFVKFRKKTCFFEMIFIMLKEDYIFYF